MLVGGCLCLPTFIGATAVAEPLVQRGEHRAAAPRVRIDSTPGGDARLVTIAVTRLAAELRVAGFAVVLGDGVAAEGDGSTLPSDAQAGGEAARYYAQITLGSTASELRLDISSRSAGASTQVVLVGREREAGALALQATELLRAGLIPRVAPRASPASEPKDEPAPAPPANRERGRLFVDAAGTLLTNWGASDRLPLLSLAAGYQLPGALLLSGAVDIPLATGELEATRGVADYRAWLGGVQAEYVWLRTPGGSAAFGLCAGAAKVSSEGRPEPPLEPLSESTWSYYVGAVATAELRVTRMVGFIGQLRVLGLSPNPVVSLLGDERRLGNPSILLSVGWRVGTQ